MSTDVTQRKQAEQRLRRRARQQATVARLGQRALSTRDLASLKRAAAELVRDSLDAEEVRVELDAALGTAAGTDAVEVPLAAGDAVVGVLRVELSQGQELEQDDRAFLQAVANVLTAAVEHDTAQQRLEHQALHDPLTGLPNRTLLLDRIEHALRRQERMNGRVAVLFADLDRFKLVNDGLGHSMGDRVLLTVCQRMQGALRPGDTIARLGGDEFAVLCESIRTDTDTIAVAQRLLGALATPLVIEGNEVYITASGAAVGSSGDRAETLLRDADLAMYRAKTLGRNRYVLYDQDLQRAAVERLHLNNALRRALRRGELRLCYQPEVDLRTGQIVQVEALMRWEHPDLGSIPPSEFIPLAEETGIIASLGEWALRTACAEAATWTAVAGVVPAVAVNLSPKQLNQPDLCEIVVEALLRSGLPPERLWLEVIEGAVMHEAESAVRTLQRLKEFGVRIAIDDFGTGYSSLAKLKAFPLDALRIDRSFVSGLGDDIEDQSIVAATIELARTLALYSIAEGVETDQQLQALRSLGCDIGQGYHWSPPVEAAELVTILCRLAPGLPAARPTALPAAAGSAAP